MRLTSTSSESLSPLRPSADDDVFGAITTSGPNEHVSAATNALAARIAKRAQVSTHRTRFFPRPDRFTQIPTAANAQGLYPPNAILFVPK